jgi:hypothetical protein
MMIWNIYQTPTMMISLRTFTRVLIFGWAKKEDPERAHEYLIAMIEQGLQPDSFCFDKVIEAYTIEGGESFRECKQVFQLMEKCSEAGEVKPNERVYTSFIRAMTKAEVPQLAKEAFVVLQRMNELAVEDRGIKPSVFTYNAVLKACAASLSEDSTTNIEAFKIALTVFNELRAADTKEEPDHVTFGNMLQCAALLPQGSQREAMIASTFQLCCRRGFVNTFVIRDLQFADGRSMERSVPMSRRRCQYRAITSGWVKRFEKTESPRVSPQGKRGPPRGTKRTSETRHAAWTLIVQATLYILWCSSTVYMGSVFQKSQVSFKFMHLKGVSA